MLDRHTFSAGIATLAEAFSKKVPAPRLAVYFDSIEDDVDPRDWLLICKRLIRDCDNFPSVKKILEASKQIRGERFLREAAFAIEAPQDHRTELEKTLCVRAEHGCKWCNGWGSIILAGERNSIYHGALGVRTNLPAGAVHLPHLATGSVYACPCTGYAQQVPA